MRLNPLPPLSLYVHLPWCVRKCPYCDFNSHAERDGLPEERYVDALLKDLVLDTAMVDDRAIETIFIGGGTPSLFSAATIARLLKEIRANLAVTTDAEITLEANPGTAELDRFYGYREAGVNRLSIGVQSFDGDKLKALGRIHGPTEAVAAANAAQAAGFENVNLDLMYGLPHQNAVQARADIAMAVAQQPTHISAYQLTLEPNTPFYRDPPALPDEATIDATQEAIMEALADSGYCQYEVSAYARDGKVCRHNRNYWEFGDYLGIGAGAHAKISHADGVTRIAKTRAPEAYMRAAGNADVRAEERMLSNNDLSFEFMLNALRLRDGFPIELFTARTGLSLDHIAIPLRSARAKGLLDEDDGRLRPTALGRRFLNDLTMLFLPLRG